MENQEDQLNKALIEVRKAYRLIHSYQTRILDIVKCISQQMHLNILSAWPWYTETSIKGEKIDLDSPFDWIPMYLYEFVLFKSTIDNNDCRLAIIIVSDTGFFDKNISWTERNRVHSFNSVKDSSTQIVIMAGVNKWHGGGPKMMEHFKVNAKQNVSKDNNGVFIAKAYPLNKFINEGAIKSVLVDFILLGSENGLHFLNELARFENVEIQSMK